MELRLEIGPRLGIGLGLGLGYHLGATLRQLLEEGEVTIASALQEPLACALQQLVTVKLVTIKQLLLERVHARLDLGDELEELLVRVACVVTHGVAALRCARCAVLLVKVGVRVGVRAKGGG